ncbi:MAG: hypothetical protein KBC41_01370 [Candidatus Pacebacteria bacterium]|nr:hypothetical protein [Candidatus Paceibacterota bacterium]MBP9866712.1 hypothetical protein [Candidatus Paceibacterota bacterium]
MKSKRKHFLALSLASIGAIGAFASVSAASIQSGLTNKDRDEVRTAIKQAVTAGDYQAYLATTKEYKIGVPVLTESQFSVMVQAHKLRALGDNAGAKKLLDDAKITPPQSKEGNGGMGSKLGKRKDMTAFTDTQKTVMRQALLLRKEGKTTEADTLLKNAGINTPFHKGGKGGEGMKTFMSGLTDTQKAIMDQAHTLMENGKKDEASVLIKNAGITLPLRSQLQ